MDKLQWLKERQKGIGGSDVVAILGLSRWKTAFQIYLDKTGEITEDTVSSENVYFGPALEDLVAREFTNRTGKRVRRDNKQLSHKNYPFIIANIDRRVIGENAILECITASSFSGSEWEEDQVSTSHLLKCQHYLAVTGAEKCYIAVLIDGQKFLWKEILRDEGLIDMVIQCEKDFWENHVEKRIPPPIDGSEAADKYLKNRYAKVKAGVQVELEADYKEIIINYLIIKESIKTMEEELKAIENNIKNTLGEADGGTVGNYLVKWKAIVSSRVDRKKLKERYPEVYKEVCKEGISRKFEIKEVI